MVTKTVTTEAWKVTVAGAFQKLDDDLQREASDGDVTAVRKSLVAVIKRIDTQKLHLRPARAVDRHEAGALLLRARARIHEAVGYVATVEGMRPHHTVTQREARGPGRPVAAESKFIRILRRLEADGLVTRRTLARYVVQIAEAQPHTVRDVVFRDWPEDERVARLEDRIRPLRAGGKPRRKVD